MQDFCQTGTETMEARTFGQRSQETQITWPLGYVGAQPSLFVWPTAEYVLNLRPPDRHATRICDCLFATRCCACQQAPGPRRGTFCAVAEPRRAWLPFRMHPPPWAWLGPSACLFGQFVEEHKRIYNGCCAREQGAGPKSPLPPSWSLFATVPLQERPGENG